MRELEGLCVHCLISFEVGGIMFQSDVLPSEGGGGTVFSQLFSTSVQSAEAKEVRKWSVSCIIKQEVMFS